MDVEAPIRERTPNARQARSQSLMGLQASSLFLRTMVNLADQARKKRAPEENRVSGLTGAQGLLSPDVNGAEHRVGEGTLSPGIRSVPESAAYG
jgi:hypothetical protein